MPVVNVSESLFASAARQLCAACACLFATAPIARAQPEPVVTVLTDFEDDTTAARVGEVTNTRLTDCAVRYALIPARGQRSLEVEIGSVQADASVTIDLRLRTPEDFDAASSAAVFCWLKTGATELSFRLQDSTGAVRETAPQRVDAHHRWIRVVAPLTENRLVPLAGRGPVKPPIRIIGCRVRMAAAGRQTIYLDDFQVERQALPEAVIRPTFHFDEPTKMYRPGSTIRATLRIENDSRTNPIALTGELRWLRPDDSMVSVQRQRANLPPSGDDFRSWQPMDFSQTIAEPGLYRLVAELRGTGWRTPRIVETTIAVMPTNRSLQRGRSRLFAVRSNLLNEPVADQMLEIAVARDMGVQVLVVDAPWSRIEPQAGAFVFDELAPVIRALLDRDVLPAVRLVEPPAWVMNDPDRLSERRGLLIEALAGKFGRGLSIYLVDEALTLPDERAADAWVEPLRSRLSKFRSDIEVFVSLPPGATKPTGLSTRGDADRIVDELIQRGQGLPSGWWTHVAAPLSGSGTQADAAALLQYYVLAAQAGATTLEWVDLRDDLSLPGQPVITNGLLRRDFSPRTTLVGFAAAVGQLGALGYDGPIASAPGEFQSHLFIGGDRQVAVLIPKPYRPRPGLLAAVASAPGELSIHDLQRRPVPLLGGSASTLFPAPAVPTFITLLVEDIQTDPVLGVAPAWVEIESPILLAETTTALVRLTAPQALRRSFAQLILPKDLPVKTSFSARSLTAAAGDSVQLEIPLSASGPFEALTATLRLSLEGVACDIPLDIRCLHRLPASAPAAGHALLSTSDGGQSVQLLARYTPQMLSLGVSIPAARDKVAASSRLSIALAPLGADSAVEVEVSGLEGKPAVHSAESSQPPSVREASVDGQRVIWLDLAPEAVGLTTWAAGQKFQLVGQLVSPSGKVSRWPAASGADLSAERGMAWIELAE